MKYVKDNILNTKCEVIIHGCNARGVMGAGVAKAIATKYPECEEKYRMTLNWMKRIHGDKYEKTVLGLSVWYDHFENGERTVRIENLITQLDYGNHGVFASISAIDSGIRDLLLFNLSVKEFAIPKIGCGFGGLKWENVSKVLQKIEEDTGIEFIVYEI